MLSYAEFETRKALNANKFIIKLESYSEADKEAIFINHLLFYGFEISYFTKLIYEYKRIINHPNYSPRHIEYFIKQYPNRDNANRDGFFDAFLKYLDSPKEYWNDSFNKLNGAARLILLILLISNDPMEKRLLDDSFSAIQEAARFQLNENIKPLAFIDELKLLEDFYLISEKEENGIVVRFQSPGIKDYLLEYLRIEGKAWIKPLLENAIFFDQLNFIFDTEEGKIEEDNYDYENNIDLAWVGQKIVLSDGLLNVLKNKIFKDLHQLSFCRERQFEDSAMVLNYNPEETKYFKLYLCCTLFDIKQEINKDVRQFIIDEIKNDLDNYKGEGKMVGTHSMDEFPRLISIIMPYMQLDADFLISSYCKSITFTSEYHRFLDLKEFFPLEFNRFFRKNLDALKPKVKRQIIDDLVYYKQKWMDIDFDEHFDSIEDICREYEIELTSEFIKEINENSGRRTFKLPKSKK